MSEERRATIEAAFAAAENDASKLPPEAADDANVQNPVSEVAESRDVPAQNADDVAEKPAGSGEPDEPKSAEISTESGAEKEAAEAEAKPVATERAPQSWKAAAKTKWAELDPEVKQEVLRRDREITQTLNETTSARNFAKQFGEVVAPFAQRLQAMNAHPLRAVQNLLQADYVLSTGSKHARAEHIAKLIKDYDIDIGVLDETLAGRVSPAAVEEDRFAKLLDQRLAPVQQFLSAQTAREQSASQERERRIASEIQTMSTDAAYPHFETVRDAMADLIEISERRGASWDLKTLYNRAVAADSSLSIGSGATSQAELAKLAAQRAQRAKAGSVSVKGAPTGAKPLGTTANDRRATIAAAFDAHGG